MKTTYPSYLPKRIAPAVLALCITIVPGLAPAQTPPPSPAAAVESPSELLERGVYNEETKGDLDAAIAIYQQLATQVHANDSLAAQAELRLGQCELKKGDKAAATEAFQKLISDYPGQTDLVAKAKSYVAPQRNLLPAPWVDGERLLLKMSTLDGNELGAIEYRSDLVLSGSQQVWRVGARSAAGSVSSVSSVDVAADSFTPLTSHWKHSMLGEVDAIYTPGQVELRRKGKDPAVIQTSGEVLDNEESVNAVRRMPLAPGYKTTLSIFSTLGGAPIQIDLTVAGVESVTVPAGTFQCWKVVLSTVNQTFWFSTDANRYLVKFEAGPLTVQLDSIAKRGPNVPVTFSDSDLGVSVTAPPQWVVIHSKGEQPPGQALIRTFDPDADTLDGGIRYFVTSGIPTNEQKSSQAWAEGDFRAEQGQLGSDVKIRPEGWKSYTVAGLPGIGAVVDSTLDGKPVTSFLLWVIAPKNSERFTLIAPSDKFDGLMSQFQNIVSSYQRN